MSADCGKLKNSNCFRHTHRVILQKFGHILTITVQVFLQVWFYRSGVHGQLTDIFAQTCDTKIQTNKIGTRTHAHARTNTYRTPHKYHMLELDWAD